MRGRSFPAVAALFLLLCLGCCLPTASAKKVDPHPEKPRVLFVPHDNRPISDEQTADTLRMMEWDIVVPPDDLLGGRGILGDPEAVWAWLEQEAPTAHIAVVSTDTLLYGSLVGSRKHAYPIEEIEARLARFAAFKAQHPKLRLYAFGSVMRTPRSAEASGGEEPSYYAHYGSDIFRFTALTDKQETDGLTRREKKEYAFLQRLIPEAAIEDWLARRNKNFHASARLIDLTRAGTFQYLALGRDDNAPYSQTHMESRKLAAIGEDLGVARFQAMAGIDEFALMMLTRAVNDWTRTVPFVYVKYNWGRGGSTVPSYSDETISDTIKAHVMATGGLLVTSPKNADFVLCVNTNPNGKTYEANDRANDGKPHEGTKYFVDLVAESVAAGPTCVADIAFANGADNALMEALKARDLLFQLRAYAGWNTATNSTGFVLCQGMLSAKMEPEAYDQLLLRRYLDDWVYQANIRGVVARQLGWFRASGAYSSLDERREAAAFRATKLMQRFCEDNLPPFPDLPYLTVTFPWNRMFEARFSFPRPFNYQEYKARHAAP